MSRDRADELAALDDLWPEISLRLFEASGDAAKAAAVYALDLDDYSARSMRDALEEKFRKGEAEHGRDWLGMSRDDLLREIRAELQDLVLYHAMLLARWVTDDPAIAPPFLTNRDPGDEQDTTD